mmetsp:Transcript_1529/g.4678  ORF Transcript_1529/g.4678 Transcript_1529/m.4678 type:complete len:253 (+) Transcript_1529:233-991(+)
MGKPKSGGTPASAKRGASRKGGAPASGTPASSSKGSKGGTPASARHGAKATPSSQKRSAARSAPRLRWDQEFAAVSERICQALQQLSSLAPTASKQAPADTVPAKFSNRLGGIPRIASPVEHIEGSGAGTLDFADVAPREEVLYEVKSELLPALESALESGVGDLTRGCERYPDKAEQLCRLMDAYCMQYEVAEAICRSLTVDTNGDVLGAYVTTLKCDAYIGPAKTGTALPSPVPTPLRSLTAPAGGFDSA